MQPLIRWTLTDYPTPETYEAALTRTIPQTRAARIERLADGRFQASLRVVERPDTTFHRAISLGWSSLAQQWSSDHLGLQSYLTYRDLDWRSPQQVLKHASLPLLLTPHQEYRVRTSYRDVLMACFSQRRMLAEVAIAREGVVSPSLFLAQGSAAARLQSRRILEEIAAGLEIGLTEDSLAMLERALMTTVAHHWNPDERRFETSHRHVTLAIDWMQMHLNQPFAWSALCTQVGVTQRSLELAFQRELELSPNHWLKQERLRCLRQTLLNTDLAVGVPIARLFESCGLPYCGSSQRAYNRVYDETPCHTRHRASRG